MLKSSIRYYTAEISPSLGVLGAYDLRRTLNRDMRSVIISAKNPKARSHTRHFPYLAYFFVISQSTTKINPKPLQAQGFGFYQLMPDKSECGRQVRKVLPSFL